MLIYFYSLTFFKVLLFYVEASERVSDSVSKAQTRFASGTVSLNNDTRAVQKKCNRVEDVKLTLQEWSEIILVSFKHFPSASTSSSSSSSSTTSYQTFDITGSESHQHQHHKHQMFLRFTINKTNYDLPLRLYRDAYREALKITLQANKTFSRSIPKNCHYFGNAWKNKRTLPVSAFINLCSKTSGLILIGGETFIIKPVELEICDHQNESSRSHMAFKMTATTTEDAKPMENESVCGNKLWTWKRFQSSDPHRAEYLRNLKIGKSKSQNFNKSPQCLVIKLGLVVDHTLMSMMMNASIEDVKQQMLLLSNVLNQLLRELHKNIQVELVRLDLWTDGDLFPTSSGVRWTLSNLVRNVGLFSEADGPLFHYLHLLSGQSDGSHYGASIPDSICTERAVGFSYVENPDDLVSMATGIAHLLGHVLGLEHDGSDGGSNKNKKCPDNRGLAMSPKRLHNFPNMLASFPTSSSSPPPTAASSSSFALTNKSGDRINKNKRNNSNNSSHYHDDHHHRHRYHHFHLGWSACSQHDFGLNLKSRFLDCLRAPCTHQHHHHHHQQQPEESVDALSRKGSNRSADRKDGDDGFVIPEDGEDASLDEDDNDDASLPGRENSGIKKRFSSECGNGILERGEECDCGSFEDCRASDPCCNPTTCLLEPWATCRKGGCCTNCTLSPSNHVCREMKNTCDVPEFCSGSSEECPEDSRVLNGQPCLGPDEEGREVANETDEAKDSSGLCYDGKCRSYDGQCAATWGSGSSKASDGCFSTFNRIGAMSGHCGSSSSSSSQATLMSSLTGEESSSGPTLTSSTSSSEFIKCSQRNVMCGLLHCKGGPQKPVVEDANSILFETTITSFGKSYQCKVLSNPNEPSQHLVEDGSPCSPDSICVSNECIPTAEAVEESVGCPRGMNNVTCSGNGVCTDKLECFCSRHFSGRDCSSPVSETKVPTTSADESPELSSIEMDYQQYYNNNNSVFNKTNGVAKVALENIRNSANALWLLGAMSCVIVGASAILILCLVCYKRKTPKLTKKQQICQLRNQSLMCKSDYESSSRVNRIISFGSLPSYRADKLRKAMKGSNHSETESEKSSKRNSGEVSIKVAKEVKATYLPLPDPPDKGILKRPERKGQRRSRAAAREEAALNTGSDASSIPGDLAVCSSGTPNVGRVDDAEKSKNESDGRPENSVFKQNANCSRDSRKSYRNSLVIMPDILPKVAEHNKSYEMEGALSENSKRDNSNVLSQNISTMETDLKGEVKITVREKFSKRSKARRSATEESSFIDGTGTMSSFLSASDLEASPRPAAPAPSLCSDYSPLSLANSKVAPPSSGSRPGDGPRAECQNVSNAFEDETPSSSSPISSCSTFTSSLSEALVHDLSQVSDINKRREASSVPLRRSADRTATKQTNPTNPVGISVFPTSGAPRSCSRRPRDEVPTSLEPTPKSHQDSREHSFDKSINRSLPQRTEAPADANAEVFKPDPRGAYTKAPGSPGVPDDDDDDDFGERKFSGTTVG